MFLLLHTNQELSSMITLFLKAAQNHLLTTKGFYFMAKTMTRTLSWRLFITLLDFEVVPRVFWSWRHLRSFICCLLQYSNLAEKGNPCENIHQRWWKELSESKKKYISVIFEDVCYLHMCTKDISGASRGAWQPVLMIGFGMQEVDICFKMRLPYRPLAYQQIR